MASLAIAAAVVGAAGQAASAIAQSNALRSQASARRVAGEQELAQQKSLLRRELGESAVSASASGLLGGSFEQVFTSQAIEDANFLGRIQQRTDFEVASLKQQARSTLATGLIGAAATGIGGVAGARAQAKSIRALEQQNARLAIAKIQKTERSRNIFSERSLIGRNPRTATFF